MDNLPPQKPPVPPHDPYAFPQTHTAPMVDPASRLGAPGAGLIIVGIFSALSALVFLGWALFMSVAVVGLTEATANLDELDRDNQMTQQDKEAVDEMTRTVSMFGTGIGVFLVTISALILVTSCLMIYGGIQMTRARSHGICMIAAVLAMLPTGCWLLSLPIGIWALVVLLDSNVKARFS